MARKTYPFRPNYAASPGLVIRQHLEARDISPAELARRCGCSREFVSELIAGQAPVTPEIALQLEKVFEVSAEIWLNIEKRYRWHLARVARAEGDKKAQAWVKGFPVKELLERGLFKAPSPSAGVVWNMLDFFDVRTVNAWETRYGKMNVAYRHSPAFESKPHKIATWLRLAEIYAEEQECEGYSPSGFRSALKQVRHLTQSEMPKSLDEAIRICNEAGVALAFVEPLRGMRPSGAAWWQAPHYPIIALSTHHKSNDGFWFSFFHEAAHILLHRKKLVFIDDGHRSDEDDFEAEADRWAENFLIPPPKWKAFTGTRKRYGQKDIEQFAEELGIAPGIIVGRLQHEKLLPRNRLNNLKVKPNHPIAQS